MIVDLLPLALAGASSALACDAAPANAPARDGNVAIRDELETARGAATAAAWDLFVARHPDHPLAAEARRERAALRPKQGRRGARDN